MNETHKLIDNIKDDLLNLREIFDYYLDSYGMPENYKRVDFDELIKKVDCLKNAEYFGDSEKTKFEESKALNDLVYLFLLDNIASIEEDINEIAARKKNFINIKEKIKKFRKKQKNR